MNKQNLWDKWCTIQTWTASMLAVEISWVRCPVSKLMWNAQLSNVNITRLTLLTWKYKDKRQLQRSIKSVRQVTKDMLQRSIKSVWQVTRDMLQRSIKSVWVVTRDMLQRSIKSVWVVTRDMLQRTPCPPPPPSPTPPGSLRKSHYPSHTASNWRAQLQTDVHNF